MGSKIVTLRRKIIESIVQRYFPETFHLNDPIETPDRAFMAIYNWAKGDHPVFKGRPAEDDETRINRFALFDIHKYASKLRITQMDIEFVIRLKHALASTALQSIHLDYFYSNRELKRAIAKVVQECLISQGKDSCNVLAGKLKGHARKHFQNDIQALFDGRRDSKRPRLVATNDGRTEALPEKTERSEKEPKKREDHPE